MTTTRIQSIILLRLGWRPPIDEFCAKITARYPILESVSGLAAEADSGMPDAILIDGARVSMSIVNAPYPPEQLLAPVRLIEHVDPTGLVNAQLAYVMLSAEAPEGNTELAEAYAALVTLVSAVVAEDAPSVACFWSESWRLVTPAEMSAAADQLLAGELPRDLWISFAEIKGERAGGEGNRGLLSFGLRVFAGREVEVAPAPIPLATAEGLARLLSDQLIDEVKPIDFDQIRYPGFSETVTLRLAENFLRPRQPALVALPESSLFSADTLAPKASARRGGLVSRLFGGSR
ncbi:MAG: hypothetical protein AAFS07_10300 [Pseudomonadota bacterium]